MRLLLLLMLLLAGGVPAPLKAEAAPARLDELVKQVSIPFETFTLNNGLRVVVHTDRKAPLVSVNVWYHVGSVDEPKGRSGFAHLFEHIMFRGSKHSRQDHFRRLEEAGATQMNGTTDFNRTNYFQTVPTPALELALFLESDRMGWLLPAIDQAVLDSERDIVLNEKRDGENAPGGLLFPALLAALYPPDHPYSIPAIGREPDLRAATLEDAKAWFRSHYGPNNAVLVLAGDIDAATARPMVERWFGQIPPGPRPARFAAPVPDRRETTRQTIRDRVATVRLIRAWALPGARTPGLTDLDVGLATLGAGPTSLLFDRLVRAERLAVAVSAGLAGFEEASLATVSVEVRPGVDPDLVDARVDALLAEWLARGPDADEVARVATRSVAATIRGLEQVGGFGGKGQALAAGMVFAGDPGDYRRQLAELAAVTPQSVRAAANRFLAAGDHRLRLEPGERDPVTIDAPQAERVVARAGAPAPRRFRPQGVAVDRSAGPPAATTEAPALRTPPIERARLSNGIEVQLVVNRAVPVVRVQLAVDGGVAADSRERPGTQRLMLAALREGTNGRLGPLDGPEIARQLERLGASVSASAAFDRTRFGLNALAPNLAASVALFADIVTAPSFPEAEVERLRGQLLASLAAEAVSPQGLALRAAPALAYGRAHPYGASFTGNGTEAGMKAVMRADLVAFHAGLLQPGAALIQVVGDTDMATILPLLEAGFGGIRASGPQARILGWAAPAPAGAGRIRLIDRPGAPQALVMGAAALPLTGRDDTLALNLANDVFGGMATSRLMKLLREAKGWSYGASSSISGTRLEMPFILSAPVDRARAGETIGVLRDMLAALRRGQPVTAEEMARARLSMVRALPGDFETGGALLAALERNALLGRPDDWLDRLPDRLAAVPLAAVQAAPLPGPDDLAFIVVGDAATLRPQLLKLGLPVDEGLPD